MKYLVIGAGGTGGLIGGYLAKKDLDVTIIARGQHLLAMKEKGLTIKTYGHPPVTLRNLKSVAEDELEDRSFDVIFVTVKAYSLDEVMGIIEQTSHSGTLIIPILNSLGAGTYLRENLSGLQIFDGCIYITGYISALGEVSQNNTIFRIVYGLNSPEVSNSKVRLQMEADLKSCGISVRYSTAITAEIFRKLSFTSAFAAVAACYDKQAADLQVPGVYRNLLESLLEELYQISVAAKFDFSRSQIIDNNLSILDSLSPDFTASIQKDMKQGKPDEREQLIFDIVRLAGRNNTDVPNYLRIANHFGYAS
ncbi:ketopantoate reductase family protein [Desertivirga arenae]|uniref:ketopantoate reductase family protein n=1 Tax=Desertivirga arenae TaxID=2810309 RepID=UPI001A95DBB8|nr:ketopantoate reductase family protein [Pedobacter sp. SYSU D00823]